MIERIGQSVLVVTDEEIRQHCRIDEFQFEEERATIGLYALAAQDAAERITRRSIGMQAYRQTERNQVSEVCLSASPFGEIQSVTVSGQAADYSIEYRHGIPVVKLDQPGPDAVVTYTAGYPSVPDSIRSWILLRIGALYEHREESAEKPVSEHRFAQHLLTPYIARFIVE